MKGAIKIPLKLNDKPIQVKRKYGKYPAKFIPSLIEIINTPFKFRQLPKVKVKIKRA